MASLANLPSTRPAMVFAALSLACEALAWWLVGAGTTAIGLWLGLSGMVLFVAACAWLWRQAMQAHHHVICARVAAGRAFDNESAMDHRRQASETSRDVLADALDALPIGIAIFNTQDRLVLRNQALVRMFPGVPGEDASPAAVQVTLDRELILAVAATTSGDPAQSFTQHLAAQGADSEPALQKYSGDRWIHSYAARTSNGITVLAQAEVTNLVRKEQLLAQANENLSRQSITDGLTGIANRRRFDEMLANEWQRAARVGTSLSLLMVDIDHFKRYNDHYGHLAGDECLRRVTQVLASCVRRAGELLARYGGEEFVLLLPGADLGHAQELAQRCLQRVQQENIPHSASPSADHVTFSIGVAQVYPTAATDREGVVNAADAAMYRAKTEGRARYVVAGQADWEIDKDAPRSSAGELT